MKIRVSGRGEVGEDKSQRKGGGLSIMRSCGGSRLHGVFPVNDESHNITNLTQR